MKNTSSPKVSKRRFRMALMCLIFFIQVTPCWIISGCGKNYARIEQEQTKENDSDRSNEDNSDKEAERQAAATKIQAVTRGLIARKAAEAARVAEAKKNAATKTQATFRGFLVRKKEAEKKAAAPKLQAATRGLIARKDFVEKRVAATKIQKAVRALIARNTVKAEEAKKQAEEESLKQQEEAAAKNAATKIQALARGLIARKDFVEKKVAVTKLQTVVRKHNAEKQLAVAKKAAAERARAEEEERVNEEAQRQAEEESLKQQEEAAAKNAATKIQAVTRGLIARKAAEAARVAEAKKNAATKTQATFRGFLVRKKEAEKKAAAPKLQAATRGLIARKDFVEKRVAATKIQKAVRALIARKDFANKKEVAAATRLQAAYRGYLARNTKKTRKKEEALRQSEEERQRQEAAFIGGHNAKNKVVKAKHEITTKTQTTIKERVALKDSIVTKEVATNPEELDGKCKQEPIGIKNSLRETDIITAFDRRSGGGLNPASKAVLKEGEEKNIDEDVTSTTEGDGWEDMINIIHDDIINITHEQAPVGNGGDQAISPSTHIDPTDKLPSWAMHKVIKTIGLQTSANTFESGGVKKPTFFYKEDSNSGEKTYIAFADNREPGNIDNQRGGEQSISIVLQAIKKELGRINNNSKTKILIPLQQIGKKHWTLLAITLTKCATSGNNTYTAEATHYDSKGTINKLRDAISKGKKYVDGQVKEHFSAEVNYEYEGTQGLFDIHNCGRYTLIKLLALINPEENLKTIEDINRMINAK